MYFCSDINETTFVQSLCAMLQAIVHVLFNEFCGRIEMESF